MNQPAVQELPPAIPGCTPHKYYQSPPHLKRSRPKRKVAIVFGYIGEKYYGLQWNRNPECPTVEESLLRALFETDMISPSNMSSVKLLQQLGFERASRTDRGVHALRNVISMHVMLPYDPAYAAAEEAKAAVEGEAGVTDGGSPAPTTATAEDDSADRFSHAEAKRLLNLALPADIHVYEVVPVTRSFNAYLNCGWRRYEYYLPTYCLMDKAAYCGQFFPEELAPAEPSLHEVGVKKGERLGRVAKAPAGTEEGAAPQEKVHGPGRTQRGHFPMRKGKKRRLEAAAAAAAGEEKEADTTTTTITATTPVESPKEEEEQESEEEEDDRFETVPLDQAHATHFTDGMFASMIFFRSIPEEAMRHVAASYRLGEAQLAAARALFAQYEGTHLYHNFTPGGRSTDPSCNRFIKQVTVSEPFILYPDGDDDKDDAENAASSPEETRVSSALVKESVEYWSPSRFFSPDEGVAAQYADRWDAATPTDPAEKEAALREGVLGHMGRVYGHGGGMEVVRIELEGQSFLLNQIRKMIGAVICCCATDADPATIRGQLLNAEVRRGIPMAPANGLFLSFLDFSRYNVRLERIQDEGHNNGRNRGALDLSTVDPAELAEWRARTVAVVLRNEMAEDICGRWMRSARSVLRLAWGVELP